jgi:hypothetical protein
MYKRTRRGKKIYRKKSPVYRVGRRKTYGGKKSSILRRLKNPNVEVNFATNALVNRASTQYFNNLSDKALSAVGYLNLNVFPGVGTGQYNRIGNQIQNVYTKFKVQINMLRQTLAFVPIAFNQCRVIIFTSPQNALSGLLENFWELQQNLVPLEHNYVNRSKYTVLFDKKYAFINNQNGKYPASPLGTNSTDNIDSEVVGKQINISFTRKFDKVLFASETTNSPKYAKQYTYIAVLQANNMNKPPSPAIPASYVHYSIVTRTYFTG